MYIYICIYIYIYMSVIKNSRKVRVSTVRMVTA